MSRLRKKEFIEAAADLDIGEQIHINHADCPAGMDTKRRLYIKRTEEDGIVAYCQHCGQSGYHRENERRYRSVEKIFGGSTLSVSRNIKLPHDSSGTVGEWPARAKVWLYRYGITDEEIARYGIVYSDTVGRVLLPVYNNGSMVGYQARRVLEDESEKYLTKTSDPSRMVWYTNNTTHSNDVVFCEDILSAIRVGRRVSSCALLGINIKDEVLHSIIKNHDSFTIFLDDDNRQVILGQIALKNKLELFGSVRLIKGVGKDPKECSDTELEEILG